MLNYSVTLGLSCEVLAVLVVPQLLGESNMSTCCCAGRAITAVSLCWTADCVLLAVLVVLQLLGESNMSTASDVYSFGIIMYEMLTFKIPFEECAKAMVRVHLCRTLVVPTEDVHCTARHDAAYVQQGNDVTA